MEAHGVPPFRPHSLRSLWQYSYTDVMVPCLATLHTLPEAMGAETVRPTPSSPYSHTCQGHQLTIYIV